MKKIAFRLLSVSLAFLLAINTAAAGRWLRSCWDAPVACCPMPCEPVSCCEPASCGTTEVVVETTDCGCGETVVSSSAPMVTSHSMVAEPTPAEPPAPTEVYEPAPATAFDGGFRSDNVAPIENDPPSDDWDAGIAEPAEEPTEEMFAEELPPAPADEADAFGFDEPAMEEPADDLFAEETAMAEEPMVDEPADDLFGAEPAEEGMEASDDDLFGSDEPAVEDAGDDLFGEPAAEEPAVDLFGAEPMEEPADEPMEADDDLFGTDEPADDDLFGEPADDAPAEEMPADDLFGAEPEEPAFDEAADDLFGAPAADEPAEAEAPADDLFGGDSFDDPAPAEEAADDLFGDEGLDTPAADEAPADAMPAEEAPADDNEDAFDDLFGGFGAILREPGGVESAQDRTWIDNTGRFSTVARLIAIDAGAVRLMKSTGTVATVPLARLSQNDLEFVSRQSLAQHHVQEAMIARGVRPAADQPKQASNAAPLRTAQL